MKKTGIIRRVDELGRVVLPVEMRRALDIQERDQLQMSLEGEVIMLQKLSQSCVFCSGIQELAEYRGKYVCRRCVAQIST